MTRSRAMLDTAPSEIGFTPETLAACIDACFECAQTCVACADACLAEPAVDTLRRCISRDLNCADICNATGRILSRQTNYDAAMTRVALEACAEACRLCVEECEHHGDHMTLCAICAQACRTCEQACRTRLDSMTPTD